MKKFKTVTTFALFFAICLTAIILDLNDGGTDVYPTDDTKIILYGESHGSKEYYDAELQLWQEYYDDACKDLFVELPYYSAEFLNVWMKEDSNDLLDVWFEEISGTLSGNEYYYDFLRQIKKTCPKTVFYGTDVGHQFDTTGARYLKYLEESDLKDSENYKLARECIRQGQEYYLDRTNDNGVSDLREEYMISNFKEAYIRQGSGKIMGIYGSYHTALNVSGVMAERLKAYYGNVISSVKISSVMLLSKNPYEFGFCFTGFILLAMLFIPDTILALGKKSEDYEQTKKSENKILLIFKRIGEVATTISLLIFPSINTNIIKLPDGIYFRWNILLWLTALILMILYECYFIKRFKNQGNPKDGSSSFAGFSLAKATLPILAVFLLGVYSHNLIVTTSAIILGIGQIGLLIANSKKEKPDDFL